MSGVSERYIFQQAVDADCATQGMPTFAVDQTQAVAFKNFRFAGSSYFDIGPGLLPFSITLADGNSTTACTMLTTDQESADAFEIREAVPLLQVILVACVM
jgi:hypothetical protein